MAVSSRVPKMITFNADPNKMEDEIEICRVRIRVWFERAAIAYEKDAVALSKDALLRWWQYRFALAELEGTEPPEQPKAPIYYFAWREDSKHSSSFYRRPGSDPDQPALVPLRPRPDAGAGEIELPLPESPQQGWI
ncbi:MAG: hypothetical protein WC028_19060 [Candidatus Obscuribacterales bacterium]